MVRRAPFQVLGSARRERACATGAVLIVGAGPLLAWSESRLRPEVIDTP